VSKKSFIDSVKVGSPCGEEWARMEGTDRVRFCSHCAKDVNNLSEMTRKEATRFVRASGGNICIRYVVDPRTKRPIFAEQLLQITRRVPGVAAGALTASIAVSTTSYAQPGNPPADPSAVVKVFKDRVIPAETTSANAVGRITGTVTDPNGAVIAGAVATLVDVQTGTTRSVTANDEGVYAFDGLAEGNYQISVQAPGFLTNEREVTISSRRDAHNDAQLGIGISETVEVRADAELGLGTVVNGGAIAIIEYTSPLSQAVADEDKGVIRDLVIRGEKVNAREDSYSKITPLFIAIETGDLEIVQMLLDAGAKVNIRSTSKETPLMRLDQDATRELVELLVRYGAKVNVADEDGSTPLIHAMEYSTPEAARALIDAGADVNAANNDGETALMKAADRGDVDNVRALLFAGANINARDKEGDSAWKYADAREVQDLLLSFNIELTDAERSDLKAEREERPSDAPPADTVPEPTPPTIR